LLVLEVVLEVLSDFDLELGTGDSGVDETIDLSHGGVESVVLLFDLSDDLTDARDGVSEHDGRDEDHDDDEQHLDFGLLLILSRKPLTGVISP
jgi:hypothetical protein